MSSKMKEQRDETNRSKKYEETFNIKTKNDHLVKLRLENIDLQEQLAESKLIIKNLSQELKKFQIDNEAYSYRNIVNECNQKINTALERFQSEFIKMQDQAERIDSRLTLSSKTIRFLQNITISEKCKASLLEKDIKEKSETFVKIINSRNEIIGERSSVIARQEVRIKELINELSEKLEIINYLNEKLKKDSEEYNSLLNQKSIDLECITEKNHILEAENVKIVKNEKDLKLNILEKSKEILRLSIEIEKLRNLITASESKLESKENEINVCEIKINDLEVTCESLKELMIEHEKIFEENKMTIKSQEKIISGNYSKVNELLSKNVKAKIKLNNAKEINSSLEKEYTALENSIDQSMMKKNVEIELLNKIQSDEITDMKKTILDQRNEIAGLNKEIENISNDLEHAHFELQRQLSQILEKGLEIKTLERNIEAVVGKNNELDYLREASNKEVQERNTEILNQQTQIKDLSNKLKMILNDFTEFQDILKDRESEISAGVIKYNELLRSIDKTIDEKNEEIEKLKNYYDKEFLSQEKKLSDQYSSIIDLEQKLETALKSNEKSNSEILSYNELTILVTNTNKEIELLKEAHSQEIRDKNKEIQIIKESNSKNINEKNKEIEATKRLLSKELKEKNKEIDVLKDENSRLLNKIKESTAALEEKLNLYKVARNEDIISSIKKDYENQMKRLYANIEELKQIYENKLLEIQNESLKSIEKTNALKKRCSCLKSILTQKSDGAIAKLADIQTSNNQILLLLENETKNLADYMTAINKGANIKFEEAISESCELRGLEGAASFNIQFYLEKIKQELKNTLKVKSDISSEYSKLVASRNDIIEKQNLLIKQLEKSKIDQQAAIESSKRQYQAKTTAYEATISELCEKNHSLELSHTEIQEELIRSKEEINQLTETIQSNLKQLSEKESSHSNEVSLNKAELKRLQIF